LQQLKLDQKKEVPLQNVRVSLRQTQGAGIRQIEWGTAVLVTAVAILLHAHYLLHVGALWRDEINSVNVASMASLSQVWRFSEFESFPLLWTLLLRLWISAGAGATDLGLRIFGLLGGMTIIAGVWFAALRLSRTVPLLSLALIAVNPEIIRWGDSVRAWGLGAGLAIFAFVLMQHAVQSPAIINIGLAGATAILAAHCTYQNSVLLAAMVGATVLPLVIRCEWKRAVIPVGIGATAAVSVAPYLSIVRRVGRWNMLSQGDFGFREFNAKVHEAIASSGTIAMLCWIVLVVSVIPILAIALLQSRRRKKVNGVAVTAAILAVMAMGVLGLFYVRLGYPTQSWYYIGVLTLVGSSAEIALNGAVSFPGIRIATVMLAVVIVLTGAFPAWSSLIAPATNLNAVAARLNAESAVGDTIALHPWFYAITFDHYYKAGATVTTVPPIADRRVHRYDLVKQAMTLPDPTPVLIGHFRQSLESGHRVWLIGPFVIPPENMPLHPLPPPPLPGSAWHAEPYLDLWALEVAAFLRDHTLNRHQVPITAGGPFEDAGVTVFEGWRPRIGD
jgi:hypothetical protein